MKIVPFVLLLLISPILGQSQCGPGYVYLEGRQFKIDGSNFYPLVCNYQLAILTNSAPTSPIQETEFYIAQYNKYGPNPNVDACNSQASCTQLFYNDFWQIHLMGFNAVRLTIGPQWNSITGEFDLSFVRVNNGSWSPNYSLPIVLPAVYNSSTDHNIAGLFFHLLDDVIYQAELCSLKVILDVVFFDIYKFNDITVSGPISVKLINYLEELGTHFTNNTTIMAYTILEEINLTKAPPFGNYSKEQVCEFTTAYYDAIKHISDPCHLVSFSTAGLLDGVTQWDVGVMKQDFYSPHIYPGSPMNWESSNILLPRERTMCELYWLSQECPVPWIIGEIGFRAENGFTIANHAMNGDNESDQADFAEATLHAVRNCGGSGYGWWTFQSNPVGPNNTPDGYGLIRYGTDYSGIKPVVDKFQDYLDPVTESPPPLSTAPQPANYYNPWHCSILNEHIYGTVLDQNGNPVEGAMVQGSNWDANFHIPFMNPNHNIGNIFTFTYDDGTFDLYSPYDPFLDPYDYIDHLLISGFGTSNLSCSPGYPPVINLGYIIRNTASYDVSVISTTISGSTESYSATNNLNLSNIIIDNNSIVDFSAGHNINVSADFHADMGTETHIFISEIAIDCNTMNGSPFSFRTSNNQIERKEKAIEIYFNNFLPKYTISPNPSFGRYAINTVGINELIFPLEASIFDFTGREIDNLKFESLPFTFDLFGKSKGMYFVKINNIEPPVFIKLIYH